MHATPTTLVVAVQRAVAGNPSALTGTLDILSENADPTIRAAVAGNKSTPRFVLDVLEKDNDPMVRAIVAAGR